MNIETSKINTTNEIKTQKTPTTNEDTTGVNFAQELNEISKEAQKEKEEPVKNNDITPETNTEIKSNVSLEPTPDAEINLSININKNKNNNLIAKTNINTNNNIDIKQNSTINNSIYTNKNNAEHLKVENKEEDFTLNNSSKNKLNKAIEGLNTLVKEFNQTDENPSLTIEKNKDFTDNNNMINNDFNIQENKDLLPQMNPNMNFSGNGQPFSSFMNNEEQQKKSRTTIESSAQDLAEEAAILSTMAENIAIANKNQVLKESHVVSNEKEVKIVDSQSGIKIETIVKYDTIIMNQADVETFVNLVENGELNLNDITSQSTEKAFQISKTLADMLVKSKENSQPLRIDFDNNISIIIKISRDGKIIADFLPSSQVAEAYLKENLPLLRQRFDDNNIEYDSLNQRERKDNNKDNNRKKDRNNE